MNTNFSISSDFPNGSGAYDFDFRVYTFKELASIYYPDSSPCQASRNLSRFIHGDPALLAELEACGFYKGKHHLSPRMVSCIVRYMGVPAEFYRCMKNLYGR
ncbi:DUF4248 domain-containing protein [Porphyromonas crevioricanis]|uniref:DUF4248 domain-containing protein n=1 Tax=Porphyromonas crevioricanis TaxID=393921 RepID=A0A2X4PNN7_9PORP|nr:DUF4248 domain-containing protein [Porphyromonas crevioricanis]GAD07764.1 hypothetical protein PORCAN_1391 [Porphyromonas crevioricanis JCM 13913]SQH73138.1 Uncharacterised protein [Porphyromonas crevioricanis]